METVTDIFELAQDNLWLTGVMFLVSAALFVALLSQGRMIEVLLALWRVFCAIFTTPFIFLRRAVNVILGAEADDATLAGSRVFTLKKISDIYYFLVLIACLLIVAAGASAGVMSLYPKSEIEREAERNEQIKLAQASITEAEEKVAETAAPDFQERARKASEEARRQSDAAGAALKAFSDNAAYSGGIIQQLQEAVSLEDIDAIAGTVEGELSLCPGPEFTGFETADCEDYRRVLGRYIDLARTSFSKADAAQLAEAEAVSVEGAREQAEQALSDRKAEVEALLAEKKNEGFWTGKWLKARLTAMAAIVLSSLLIVIIFVWSSALFLDLISWLVAMMRALEIWADAAAADKISLEAAHAESSGGPNAEGSAPPNGAPTV
ncbi:MAG: hypothetical protein KGS00_07585 [Alphaproteobacteria bacterium]|nr:hypothetical protein [Alphaproteobacteria bacterium]